MTRHPLMSIANPTPVASHPDVTGNGGYGDDLLARRRRCDHHDAPRVMPLIRHDDAPGKHHGQRKTGCQSENVRAHVDNQLSSSSVARGTSLDSAG